jgi:hypothetical protein
MENLDPNQVMESKVATPPVFGSWLRLELQ